MKNVSCKKQLKICSDEFIDSNKDQWSENALQQAKEALEILIKWAALYDQDLDDLGPNWIEDLNSDVLKNRLNSQLSYEHNIIYIQFNFWLYKKNKCSFSGHIYYNCNLKNAARINANLPKIVFEFLSFISTKSKNNTINSYRTSINHLYFFLKKEKIIIKILNRSHIESLMKYLAGSELKAVSRQKYIIYIRAYLVWLYEKGCMINDPHTLIRSSDFPKVPKYLPRSFSVEIDQEIKKRLSFLDGIYHRTLLLLRYTGMRVGEVCNLSYHCLVDHGKGYNLKVPLGKLDKERLVPIDLDTVQLIEKIRTHCNQYSSNKRSHLLCNTAGKKISYDYIWTTFRSITYDLETDRTLVIHQIRHTYATQMSNAGMNAFSLKKILGHNDIDMTLRYIQTTQETIQAEYLTAIEKISNQYKNGIPEAKRINPSYNLDDYFLAIKKALTDQWAVPSKQLIRFYKRFERIKTDFFFFLNQK